MAGKYTTIHDDILAFHRKHAKAQDDAACLACIMDMRGILARYDGSEFVAVLLAATVEEIERVNIKGGQYVKNNI